MKATKILAVLLSFLMLIGALPLSVLAYFEEPTAEGDDTPETSVLPYTAPVGVTMRRLTGSSVGEFGEESNLGNDLLFVIKRDGRYYAMRDMAAREEGYEAIPAVDVTAWVNADGSLTVPADTLGVAFWRYEERGTSELGMFIGGREDYLSYTYSYESADEDNDHHNDAERTYTAKFKVTPYEDGQWISTPYYWSRNEESGTLHFDGSWSYWISSYNSLSLAYHLIADLKSDGSGGYEFYFRYLGTDVEYEGTEVEGYLYYADCRHEGTVRHAEYDAPTCMEKGCREYRYCELCNRYFGDADFTECFGEEMPVIPATGHDFGAERCAGCARPVPIYSKVTNQRDFDALADDTMFLLVAEYGGKYYAPDFSEVYAYMYDEDGDGYRDIHEVDEDEDGTPDYLAFDEDENGVFDYLEWDTDGDGTVSAKDQLEFSLMICEQHLTDMLYNSGSIRAIELTPNPDGTFSHAEGTKTAEFEMVDVYLPEDYDEIPENWEGGEMPYYTKCIKQFVIPNYFITAPSYLPVERMYRQRIYDFGDSSSFGVIFYDDRADYYYFPDGNVEDKTSPLPFLDICREGSVAVFDSFDDIMWVFYDEGQLAQLRLRDYEDELSFITGHDYEFGDWVEPTEPDGEGYYDTHDTQAAVYLYASAPYEAPHTCEFGDWYDAGDGSHRRDCLCGESESEAHSFGDFTEKDAATHTHTCPICHATEEAEHSFFDWIAKDDSEHIHECMECAFASVLPHDYVREVTKEPTESEVGEATHTCSLCSHFYKEELPKRILRVEANETTLTLTVPNGGNAYIPEGTIFDVVELPEEEVPEEVLGELALTAEGAPKPLAMYDLSLLLDGAEIQPNGTVRITLPALQYDHGYDSVTVIYIAPDGSYEECLTTVNEDGTISFETDHFSRYAVIGIAADGLGTGAVIGIVAGAVALLCGLVFVFLKLRTKKQ